MADAGDLDENTMQIESEHCTISGLFEKGKVFRTPRYQRNYAWTSDEIEAFKRDLLKCVDARKRGDRKPHFLGSIVTVQWRSGGRDNHHSQVIDGQQRLATFVMLATHLRKAMVEEVKANKEAGNTELADFLSKQAEIAQQTYEQFTFKQLLKMSEIPRLELSLADQTFFAAMLNDAPMAETRASHNRLKLAYDALGELISNCLVSEDSPNGRASCLTRIADVLSEDWTVIWLDTDQRKTAHMLFQVLNDRGLGLTEGELLRAATLEQLEGFVTADQLDGIEHAWSNMLSSSANRTDRLFRSIYSSYRGEGSGKTSLFSDLRDQFFPMMGTEPFNADLSEGLIQAVHSLERDMTGAALLEVGEWPGGINSAGAWHRERLRLLMVELQQSSCLPFLITATMLSEKRFCEVLNIVERFLFRYSVIAAGPSSALQELLMQQAVILRLDPSNYDIRELKKALRAQLQAGAPDDVFAEAIGKMRYSRQSSNKALKYFLMTLEHYAPWFDAGAQQAPQCNDKSRILDFATSTIEHIYPENADPADEALAPYLDTIGNLTILSAGENDKVGNKPYPEKRPTFLNSTSSMNRWIASEDDWTVARVLANRERVVEMAVAVFVV